ncbi:adenylosuccinate lyase family protein [Streptomyces sp. CBMA152]|uniref:class-II fumarase/aspartase family protein n=1 Tax=Streptomyces sp. CBMA152 TaxID=1896312 RepID=UPI00166054CA|nr:adenylosuccinate lyase family protein [Streptomyces sp. CBMA152]MBD0747740.1 adenylosuccinate lyase [Streptomyces sp. CBMA152]
MTTAPAPDSPPAQPAPHSSECAHSRSHITDSRFYGHRYSTEASHRIFCDRCRYQRWLDVEAALALSQGELGIIPAAAARMIAEAADVDRLDLPAIRAEIRRTSHSLVAFLRVFQASCEGGAGEYVHYGATTQDIQDTAQILEIRDVLDELETLLRALAGQLADLAEANASTVALGRTHAQPALPMGFGVKIAGWLDETLRHLERIEQLRPRVLAAQLFGGVGTMAGFGDKALPLLDAFAARLGLAAPAVGWHVSRDRIVEFVSCAAMVAGTMGRIGDEVRTLSRPEFGELEIGWRHGQVGSSTMPHKRNPEACEQAVVMARLAAAQMANALACMGGDHERDSRTLRIEWACVPDVSHYALSACEIVRHLVGGLAVRPERIAANVAAVAEQIATEKLMLALGKHIGKQTAHEYVYELVQAARENGSSMREMTGRDGLAGAPLDAAALDEIFDPASYLGQSAALTGRAVAKARAVLAQPGGSDGVSDIQADGGDAR